MMLSKMGYLAVSNLKNISARLREQKVAVEIRFKLTQCEYLRFWKNLLELIMACVKLQEVILLKMA